MNAPVHRGRNVAKRDAHLFYVENALATCRSTCQQIDAVTAGMIRYARGAADRTDPVSPIAALETLAEMAGAVRFLAETAVDIADLEMELLPATACATDSP